LNVVFSVDHCCEMRWSFPFIFGPALCRGLYFSVSKTILSTEKNISNNFFKKNK